jgi:8-oxo-dGTP pyrophosphatase MutT (NUDIX family)
VAEETGLTAELVDELGDVSYRYERGGRRIGKSVRFYLFSYVSGSVEDHDHEIEEALWMPLEQAARELTYAGEREMVQRALSRTAADR